MNWGDLDRFPFLADVWGDAATWVGAVGANLAFGIALVVFLVDRHTKRRSQASLVYVSEANTTVITVSNRSDKAIFMVRAVAGPMSMTTGYISGEFDEMKARDSKGNFAEFPSYEFYVLVRTLLKRRKDEFSKATPPTENIEILPSSSKDLNVPEVLEGAADVHVIFRDASGRDWAINARTKRLEKAKYRKSKRERFCGRLKARWWVAKNRSKFIWRNYLDHRKGRPDLRP